MYTVFFIILTHIYVLDFSEGERFTCVYMLKIEEV